MLKIMVQNPEARSGLIGKKPSWPHLGQFQTNFPMDRKKSKMQKTCLFSPNQACLWGSHNKERISVRVVREGGSPITPPKILVPRSWYQDLATKILVPGSWDHKSYGSGAQKRTENKKLVPILPDRPPWAAVTRTTILHALNVYIMHPCPSCQD